MISDALWVPHSKRKPRIYQPRYRRDCVGELIQIDGSHHDWFEGRSDKCCLLVFIDDATGRLMNLRFSETESAFDYMLATREYLNEHGKPVAKHSIFRVNQEKQKQVGSRTTKHDNPSYHHTRRRKETPVCRCSWLSTTRYPLSWLRIYVRKPAISTP